MIFLAAIQREIKVATLARDMEIGRKIERWGYGNGRGKFDIEI
jgi:hypothetical protein